LEARGTRKPSEITIGAPAQRLLGRRRLVLERLELGHLVQQIGEIAVLGAGNRGPIIPIGTDRRAGDQRCCGLRDYQNRPLKPHPAPERER
jgi:hypothetical protein